MNLFALNCLQCKPSDKERVGKRTKKARVITLLPLFFRIALYKHLTIFLNTNDENAFSVSHHNADDLCACSVHISVLPVGTIEQIIKINIIIIIHSSAIYIQPQINNEIKNIAH